MFAGMVIKGLTAFIEKKLGDAGTVKTLDLDKQNRQIRLVLEMVGETEPVEVELLNYSLAQDGNRTRLCFGEVRVSRAWMQSLLNRYFPEPALVIPEKYAPMVGMLL